MNDTLIQPTTWGKVGLSILPGVWLILQQDTEILSPVPRVVYTFAITIAIVVGITMASLIVERRIATWCLPALGALLWKADNTMADLRYADRLGLIGPSKTIRDQYFTQANAPILSSISCLLTIALVTAIALLCVFALYWSYRKFRSGVPRLSLWLLCFMVVDTIAVAYLSPYRIFLVDLFVLLVPIAAGLYWAEKNGWTAVMWVVACEPLWIDMLFGRKGVLYYELYEVGGGISPQAGGLEAAVFALSYLSLLCFLVVMPVGVLRSRSKRGQLGWLLLPSFLTLITVNAIPGFALRGTTSEYTLAGWLGWSLAAILLWLSLLLAATLYDSSQSQKPVIVESEVGVAAGA